MRDFEPYYTEDGSIGLYSYEDKDVYHSKFGALTEAWEKFIIPCDLCKNFHDNLNVLDICYGIGYNSKALMTFIANDYFIKHSLNKNKKKSSFLNNIVSICRNKKDEALCADTDTIYVNNSFSSVNIDCLELNESLVQLAPFFKTVRTPEEIYKLLVPSFLDCFDAYYKLEKLFVNFLSRYIPVNRKDINELLNLKFRNMHIEKEYKINPYINFILLNNLFTKFNKDYPSFQLIKTLNKNHYFKFIDKGGLIYAYFNKLFGYNSSSKYTLSALLHNIYYGYLSLRYKKGKFKQIESIFNINFCINDARKAILSLNRKYDLIFLDAFTYTKAPQLWSLEFISELYSRISNDGLLLTYSTSAQVRNTLLLNKFYVGKIIDTKSKRVIGTIASKNKNRIKNPLNNFEIGLCNTKAGIPYHDPQLRFSNREILELREFEFKNSKLISSSKYMKNRSEQNEKQI